jgi:hypothetical protein
MNISRDGKSQQESIVGIMTVQQKVKYFNQINQYENSKVYIDESG